MVVANNIFTDAAKTVRQIAATDSDADDEIIDLGHEFLQLLDETWTHLSVWDRVCDRYSDRTCVLDMTILSSYCQACSCAQARCGGRDTA